MPADDDPQALVGAVLGQRWRLVRHIGSGGLGLVFEAESLGGEGPRAVKLLRREFCEEPAIVDRFLTEALAGARIDHPGVTKVYEAARAEDGTPYLVIELLVGQALSTRMNRGRVPVEQAAPIAHDILDALAAAHAAGVVHRDLKPDNVFLARDASGSVRVKLLDFGLSRVMDAAGGMARKTRTGMLLGTPGYMSPEQVRNTKDADERSDLWSVGIIFYEMLTATLAFQAENEFARITKVLTDDPAPIEQVAPQYAHWAPFFQRALAREPGERFQTATEMAAALMAVAREGHMPEHHFQAIPASALMPSSPPPSGWMPQTGMSAASEPPPRFPHTDTAISAGSVPPPGHTPAPMVEVVSPAHHPRRISLVIALVIAGLALALGFAVGFLAGKL